MKKKGFTLIELVASLAILTIIFSMGIGSYKLYKGTYSEIQVNRAIYEIQDTLSYGEMYCKSNKINLIFYIEQKENGLIVGLKDNLYKKIKSVNLLDSLSLNVYSGAPKSVRLNINKEGKIQPGTIRFKDLNGKRYELTVRVGVNLITIRELK